MPPCFAVSLMQQMTFTFQEQLLTMEHGIFALLVCDIDLYSLYEFLSILRLCRLQDILHSRM